MFAEFILPAISFALSAISIPGPLQAFLLNVTLRGGWRLGLLVILAPLIVDGPIILLTTFLLGQLPPEAIQLIQLAGGLLLLWIARAAWLQLRSGANLQAADGAESDLTARGVLLTAAGLNALSPGPWLFWATINGPLLLRALDQSPLHAVAFMGAFYGTFLGGLALLVFVFHRMGQISATFTRRLLWVTILLLLFFGTRLILEGAGLLEWHAPLVGASAVLLMVLAIFGAFATTDTPAHP